MQKKIVNFGPSLAVDLSTHYCWDLKKEDINRKKYFEITIGVDRVALSKLHQQRFKYIVILGCIHTVWLQ